MDSGMSYHAAACTDKARKLILLLEQDIAVLNRSLKGDIFDAYKELVFEEIRIMQEIEKDLTHGSWL